MDGLISELELAEARIAGLILGDEFFNRLDQDYATHSILADVIAIRKRRQGLIERALAALIALREDGFPVLEKRSVPKAVIEDLKNDFMALETSLSEFEIAGASTVTATVGPERPTS